MAPGGTGLAVVFGMEFDIDLHSDLLQLDRWESLTSDEQVAVAGGLVKKLPDGFAFDRVGTCACGDQTHPVAFFTWQPAGLKHAEYHGGTFALIPGATTTLGYDREHPFEPTPEMLESWSNTQEEYDAPDLAVHLDQFMTPLRTVQLKPFLMEVEQIGVKHIRTPLVQIPESLRPEWGKVLLENDRRVVTELVTPKDITRESRRIGFRLPTSDEWEWACAAGSRTLWRWGNDCPMNAYPSDHRRMYGSDSFLNHPSAFGVRIAFDDYAADYCEDNIYRGGDGGGTTCGGAGFLAAWLILASAYFEPADSIDNDSDDPEGGPTGSRRVFPLDKIARK